MTAEPITVVLWKWRSSGNWKRYTAGHVNAIAAMLRRHLSLPHRTVLVTDDPAGVEHGIDILPLDVAAAKPPMQQRVPLRNAYRRVSLFSADAVRIFGGRRLLQLDLDTVITADITALVARPEPFVIWKSPSLGRRHYALNTSFVLLTAGSMAHVYSGYRADPEGVAEAARNAGWTGTDQAVVAHLGGDCATTVGEADGIVSFRDHLRRGAVAPGRDVRMVSFMDRFDPADPALQDAAPWIREHYPHRHEATAA